MKNPGYTGRIKKLQQQKKKENKKGGDELTLGEDKKIASSNIAVGLEKEMITGLPVAGRVMLWYTSAPL